ncbi:MAG: DUF3299 domain-containing protein [Pirellulales bacterium]
MTRWKRYKLGAVAGGLVPLLLLFGSGCSDSVQSRANTAGARVASARSAGDTATAKPAQTSRQSDDKDESPSPRPTSEKADPKQEATAAQSSAAGRKSTREISFDTLKFDIEKGQPFKRSMLTAGIEKLAGERVRIRGYMLPSFQQSGIKQFVLVRDNMECCFGPGAALYDCVIVEMVNDQSADFSVRPIAVEGTFSVREFKGPDDMHLAIFHLDGERVR